ncbi:MAG: oligosaccharide flippase family protein [Paludibacteraceae bacterium]|nr:oligosaccharide flippase family protein [Paludibacteraceae bacterium]
MGVIAKQSIRGTIVTYLGIAVGVITTFFVLTRFLTAEEIGLARVLIDTAMLFVGLAQLGTSSSIIRFYPYFLSHKGNDFLHEKDTDHGFFFWALVVPFIGFLLFAIIYWACRVPLGAWFGDKSPLFVEYYYFVLPIAFFMLYQTICESTCNVLMHIVVPRAVRELVVRVGLLALYLLYAFRVLSLDGFVVGLCVNYAIAAIINLCYFFSLQRINLRPDWQFLRQNKALVRRYMVYTLFLIISALTTTLAPTLSSFFVTAKMGLSNTGIFAIATYMAALVSVPNRSVNAIASPQLSRSIKEQNWEECSRLIQQVTGSMWLIGGFILLAIWVNIDLIFHILPNGAIYAEASNVILILGLSQLVLATFTICMTALNYSRYFAFSLLLSLVLTVSALLLNNRLVPLYGMEGAAWSNMLSYGLYYLLGILTVCITCRLRIVNLRWLYTLLLLVALFAGNSIWQHYLPEVNIWVDSLLRSVIIIGGGAYIAYKAKLSPEINEQIARWLNKS